MRLCFSLPQACIPVDVLLVILHCSLHFSKGCLVMQLSHCFQVPARAHGHRVMWEELVHSESAPKSPDTQLQPVATQQKSPVLQGPQERGEGPDFIDEGRGKQKGKKVHLEHLSSSWRTKNQNQFYLQTSHMIWFKYLSRLQIQTLSSSGKLTNKLKNLGIFRYSHISVTPMYLQCRHF